MFYNFVYPTIILLNTINVNSNSHSYIDILENYSKKTYISHKKDIVIMTIIIILSSYIYNNVFYKDIDIYINNIYNIL